MCEAAWSRLQPMETRRSQDQVEYLRVWLQLGKCHEGQSHASSVCNSCKACLALKGAVSAFLQDRWSVPQSLELIRMATVESQSCRDSAAVDAEIVPDSRCPELSGTAHQRRGIHQGRPI